MTTNTAERAINRSHPTSLRSRISDTGEIRLPSLPRLRGTITAALRCWQPLHLAAPIPHRHRRDGSAQHGNKGPGPSRRSRRGSNRKVASNVSRSTINQE